MSNLIVSTVVIIGLAATLSITFRRRGWLWLDLILHAGTEVPAVTRSTAGKRPARRS